MKMKRPKRVEIHVDRLVLDGLPPERRRAVAAAVERELARLAAPGETSEPAALTADGLAAGLAGGLGK